MNPILRASVFWSWQPMINLDAKAFPAHLSKRPAY
jgi:hypothetical protein